MKAFASLAVLTVFLLVPVASANAEATAIAEAAEAIVDAAALEICFAEGAGLPPAEGAELPNQSSMFSGGCLLAWAAGAAACIIGTGATMGVGGGIACGLGVYLIVASCTCIDGEGFLEWVGAWVCFALYICADAPPMSLAIDDVPECADLLAELEGLDFYPG